MDSDFNNTQAVTQLGNDRFTVLVDIINSINRGMRIKGNSDYSISDVHTIVAMYKLATGEVLVAQKA